MCVELNRRHLGATCRDVKQGAKGETMTINPRLKRGFFFCGPHRATSPAPSNNQEGAQSCIQNISTDFFVYDQFPHMILLVQAEQPRIYAVLPMDPALLCRADEGFEMAKIFGFSSKASDWQVSRIARRSGIGSKDRSFPRLIALQSRSCVSRHGGVSNTYTEVFFRRLTRIEDRMPRRSGYRLLSLTL